MSRDDVRERIENFGGSFDASVGQKTTYLVAGGKIGESKRKNAEKYGTKTIDENEFLKILTK